MTAALHRWLALGTTQQRIADSLIGELTHVSDDMAAETGTLTRLFQNLGGASPSMTIFPSWS